MASVGLEKAFGLLWDRLQEELPRIVGWVKKGALAVVDQGLISGSNFLVSIILARWLVPEQYGAYAVAYECFLLMYVVYSALVFEPMCVFGSSDYQGQLHDYLRILFRIHFGAALVVFLVLTGSAWVVHRFARSDDLSWALVGAAVGGPCILLFWLVRRAMYVRLEPQAAVVGALAYCAVLLGGLAACYKLSLVSPFVAFLVMAGGALAASPILLAKLKPSPCGQLPKLGLGEVVRKHWLYGRWALMGSLALALPGSIYYPLLGSFRGLAETGALKALLNLVSPIGQFFTALFLISLPYAARKHHDDGPAGVERVISRLTLLFAGGAIVYWLLFLTMKEYLLGFVYGGKYLQLESLIPWIALGSVLQIGATAKATGLRAVQSPRSVFVASSASGVVAIVIGVPGIWLYGVRGAVLASVLASGTVLLATSILLRRACRTQCEVALPGGQAKGLDLQPRAVEPPW